jgi:hypothetical protein
MTSRFGGGSPRVNLRPAPDSADSRVSMPPSGPRRWWAVVREVASTVGPIFLGVLTYASK